MIPKLVRTLVERRVPHILALYAGASWGLIEFVNFAVDEFLLSPHWIRVALVALLLLFPTVFMLAWFHGKPGKDVDEMPRTEKIGIPVNIALCAGVLWMLFGGEDLGAATTSITVENEDGETEERDVAKAEFRKRTILFPLDPGDGLGEEESWLAYAVPGALEYDLSPEEMKSQIPAPLDDYLLPYLESSAFAEWGDLEAARDAHGRAVQMAEAMQFGQILEDLGRIGGRIDELAGDYESGIEIYRAAMAVDPGVSLQRALGRTLRKAGRLEEAEAELREALVPVPAQPNTHFERGCGPNAQW